jgi:hypothetical protein
MLDRRDEGACNVVHVDELIDSSPAVGKQDRAMSLESREDERLPVGEIAWTKDEWESEARYRKTPRGMSSPKQLLRGDFFYSITTPDRIRTERGGFGPREFGGGAIDSAARDEHIVRNPPGQGLSGGSSPLRKIGGHIKHRIEASRPETREAVWRRSIADDHACSRNR